MVERTIWIILIGSLARVLDDALCSTNSQLLVYIIYRDILQMQTVNWHPWLSWLP